MAHGRNAASCGHNREYWSRRPGSGLGWGRCFKTATHRIERRVEARAAVDRGIAEWRSPEENDR